MNSFSHKREIKATTTIRPEKQQNQSSPSLLVPYGSIPKYKKDKKRKKVVSSKKQGPNQEPSVLAPYPFFRLALQSRPSFLTSLIPEWHINTFSIKKNNSSASSSKNEKSSPAGFMPRSLPTIASSLSLDDTAWNFSSIDSGKNSDSGTLAKGIHYASSSHYSKTASTLSGILCENYVQSQLMIMTMIEDDASEDTDVENDADGCPVTCPSLTPTSTSSTSTSDTSSSSISPTEPFFLDTLTYPPYCTFDNKIFDTTTPSDPSSTPSPSPPIINNYGSTNATAPINVPLSTFRMFRARDDEDDQSYNQETSISNENDSDSDDDDDDDTMTNEAGFGSYDDDHLHHDDEKKNRTSDTITTTQNSHLDEMRSRPHHQHDMVYSGKEPLLENSWANWEKAWQGKQWVLSMSEQDEKKDDCLPCSPIKNKQQQQQQQQQHDYDDQSAAASIHSNPPSSSPTPIINRSREPRVNSAHLRMLVAEVNMMRADKIVGPLRPRNYLPKRTDPLPYLTHSLSPSPLSFYFISAA